MPSLIERLSDTATAYSLEETRVCDLAAALERIATPEALAAVAAWRHAESNEQSNG